MRESKEKKIIVRRDLSKQYLMFIIRFIIINNFIELLADAHICTCPH